MCSGEDCVVRGWGRTIYPATIFDFLNEEYINPVTGEVDLSYTFLALLEHFENRAILLDGYPSDFGTWDGYWHFTHLWHKGEQLN